MQTQRLPILALCACGFGLPGAASAIVVTTTNDGSLLANTILGSGISISNVTYNGAVAESAGIFTDGLASGIGIESGIILTSGNAGNAVGPNTSDATTKLANTAGDADLDALLPPTTTPSNLTHDATILEFDFESAGGDVFFNYVFASEEYNEWVNSEFNDVFGFFLDGNNIALIPGTTTPVSINNVNCGDDLNPPTSHCEFFNNNDLSDGGPFFDIEYDGFTDVFTASFIGLSAGTHHIKLAIADAGDSVLDSAVFIQAGSFSDVPPPTVPEPATIALLGVGLIGIGMSRRKKIVT